MRFRCEIRIDRDGASLRINEFLRCELTVLGGARFMCWPVRVCGVSVFMVRVGRLQLACYPRSWGAR